MKSTNLIAAFLLLLCLFAVNNVNSQLSPSNTDSPSNTASGSPSQTDSPSNTASGSPSQTDSPSNTASGSPSQTDSPSNTASGSPSQTDSPSNTASGSPSQTDSPSNTASGSPSQTDSPSNTASGSPSQTDSSGSAASSPSNTASPVSSTLQTGSPSNTASPVSSTLQTGSPSNTASPVSSTLQTGSPSNTASPVSSTLQTGSPSNTASPVSSTLQTASPSQTASPAPATQFSPGQPAPAPVALPVAELAVSQIQVAAAPGKCGNGIIDGTPENVEECDFALNQCCNQDCKWIDVLKQEIPCTQPAGFNTTLFNSRVGGSECLTQLKPTLPVFRCVGRRAVTNTDRCVARPRTCKRTTKGGTVTEIGRCRFSRTKGVICGERFVSAARQTA